MKKSRFLFGRLNNEVRRNSADKAAAFHRSSLREKALPQNASRPKLRALCVLSGNKNNYVNLCESVKSVVTVFQSKITNYAKRTQFPKRANGRKPCPNNQLPITSNQLPMAKRTQNEPNLSLPKGERTQFMVSKIEPFIFGFCLVGFFL